MRPPVRWISSAPISICATAIVYRVDATAGRGQREQRGEQADDAADDDRGPHVQVGTADAAVPRQWRHPQREDDAGDPLERHQTGEQPVGALVDVPLVLSDELGRRVGSVIMISAASGSGANSGQPKTLVPRRRPAGGLAVSATSDARPALSPAWPARSGDAAAERAAPAAS